MEKENRNMYKLDFAQHLLFILDKLNLIEAKLDNKAN